MSIQRTTPDIISSILLAVWQINAPKPERKLRHLVNPTPPKDYQYLDAIATLCSLVPRCEYASAAIELGAESNHLYIATSPTAPHTLQKAMPAWIHQMHVIKSSVNVSDSTGPIGQFIADVYRICYEKLRDGLRSYRAKKLLEEVSRSSDDNLVVLGLQVDERPLLVKGLTVLTNMVEENLTASSIDEILKLHDAARTVAKFRDHFPGTEYFEIADRLSEAVDYIVAFVTAQDPRPERMLKLHQDVHWIDVASPREFTATMNTREFMGQLSDGEESLLKVPDNLTEPPEDMSKIKGSPGHVMGTGVTHCESGLLHYILDHNLSVNPYIGASQTTCYACLMLVRAFNRAFKKEFALGRRCGTVDTAWLCPEIGGQLYEELVSSLQADFRVLCAKARLDRASWRPLGTI